MVDNKLRNKIATATGVNALPDTLPPIENNNPIVSLDDLGKFTAYAGQQSSDPFSSSLYDGGKFYGGFGATQIYTKDYWTLRARSAQLFTENMYAKGLIRRLVTNEINTGLMPEACPDEQIIGVPDGSLNDWTETVENRYGVYCKSPNVCDFYKADTMGALQRYVRREAYINGDILVVLVQSSVTRLPMVQLINGALVSTPLTSESTTLRKGHKIIHGVEINAKKHVVAYWVRQEDGSFKRLPAWGEKSGRRLSWLVFGSEKRYDEYRGEPLLSIVLQSLKEIDRYRDSVQRKAVINSILAMFIEKGENKAGTLPMTGGAARKENVTVSDSDGGTRSFKVNEHIPGVIAEELQHGEKPHGFGNQGTDEKFGTFEEAVIQAVAWANEIPPEILRLAFSNNYSASQAAINEFKIYLNRVWSEFGEQFCTPIYIEWLLNETLTGRIQAPGLLESWRDLSQYDKFGAWVSVDWYGSIKPSTDMHKTAKGEQLLVGLGATTLARTARTTTGTKHSKNVKRLGVEIKALTEALQPLYDLGLIDKPNGDTSTPATGNGDKPETKTVLHAIETVSEQLNDLTDGGN